MIKSYINTSLSSTSPDSDIPESDIHVNAEDLVVTALETMLHYKLYKSPVFFKGKCVGMVHLQDLISFLARDLDKFDIFFHKTNFTVESAITILMRKEPENSTN